ncbi:MAG TPA: EAL domain-containing protein [Acidimicrobiales bacterium]|nr:EAL domain-containing protein [Acidimicrobiales bacterium]
MGHRTATGHARRTALAILGLAAVVVSGSMLSGGEYVGPLVGMVGIALVLVVVGRQLIAILEGESHARSLEAEVQARTAELQKSEVRFRSLVQASSDVITILDEDGMILFQTPSVERILGYEPVDFQGHALWELLHADDVSAAQELFRQAIASPELLVSGEFRVRNSAGEWLVCETVFRSMLHEPSVGAVVLNTRDVTERKALEAQLIREALHDPLTGLANRVLLRDRVALAMARARRDQRRVALMLVDLDDFKAVNDAFGHGAGDELLVNVSRRLVQAVRPGDTVARLGGDEFAVLLDDARGDAAPDVVASRLRELLKMPVLIAGHELFAPASIGVAVADGSTGDAEELLRNADVAMYIAKGKGKSQMATFHPDMHAEMRDRLTLASELRFAVSRGEFAMRYQPLVDLKTQRIIGVEALVRWRHRTRGLVAPSEFIPLAESTGTIIPLGRWVMEEAVAALVEFQRQQLPGERPVSVTINLSGRQFQEPGMVDEIATLVHDAGVEPWTVVLELTETILMDDIDNAIETMQAMKALGVRLALDDFGTGYSSLSYLRRFPLDILKIDKSFVHALATQEGPGLVRSVLRLGDTFRLATLAEGIEMPEQHAMLKALGCTYGQGFLFAHPLKQYEVRNLISVQAREGSDAWKRALAEGVTPERQRAARREIAARLLG